ncbi:unnamed protein product [Diabrotica balteata]|uniref:E3 ubiquitin-protein ligase n=1 Tax=Diabrotica balteata TaxID=107213 RepID=A0A9N9SZI4_DIABA|nr:unnamed protein product [Diabrotica balteata]
MAEAVENLVTVPQCKEKGDNMECAVCLQKCIHPAQLPCGHIFCFLCVKGFANQNKRCAMCRQEIPRDFIEQPNLLEPICTEKTEVCDDSFQWFYEGRNGWWQYDERTSKDLEASYTNNEKTCELLIAGFLYIIDLENMLQIRRNDPSRRRRIKRDYATVAKKGVAGLHSMKHVTNSNENHPAPRSESQEFATNEIDVNSEESSEEPESTETESDTDLESAVQRLRQLHIDNNE